MTAKLSGNVSGTQVRWQQAISKVSDQARTCAPAQAACKPLQDIFQDVSKAQAELTKKLSPMAGALPVSPRQALETVKSVFNSVKNAANEQRNLLSQENREEGGWKSIAPVLQQTSETDCGAAAAAMLLRAKGGKEGVSNEQLMKDLSSVYSTREGTTPKQLSKMLAYEGIAVKQGTSKLDKGALDGTLSTGGKAVAMVDSNKILPGGDAKPTGQAHWVVIDGMDEQGRYMVKDPGTATSYFVEAETLAKAVQTTRKENQSGGVLLVENARTPEPAATRVAEATKEAEALGDKPGTGSNTGRFGRESS